MREASFLSKNEKKWRNVESILDQNNTLSTEETVDLYIELSDDLSYSRTHYTDSVSTKYLNGLASGIYQRINRGSKGKLSRIFNFWLYDLPIIIYARRKALLYALLFFATAVLIGAISTHYDETYTRIILGDDYVDMTLENIDNGNPMGVYETDTNLYDFFAITFNNLRVSFWTFVSGFLFGLGTYYFLFYNGIMLGSFQYFFFAKGVFWKSFITIWIHGTIEISSIVLAGGAGIVLGQSLMFTGTYSRKESIVKGGKEAIKIVLGICPFIVIAGFLETYVTGIEDLHAWIKIAIILVSFCIMAGYFVVYPIYLNKKMTK